MVVTEQEGSAIALVVKRSIDRLEQTYADTFENGSGYEYIPPFFRHHLYNPPNKEARDAALDNLYLKLKKVTGQEMAENIHKLIILNKLTDDLDLETGRTLLKGPLKETEDIDNFELSFEQLLQAISETNRFDDRYKQISLVGDTLNFFFQLSKLPLIKLVMAPIRVAASIVGAMTLIETMEAGYKLSEHIKDMAPFVEIFTEREGDFIKKAEELHGKNNNSPRSSKL